MQLESEKEIMINIQINMDNLFSNLIKFKCWQKLENCFKDKEIMLRELWGE